MLYGPNEQTLLLLHFLKRIFSYLNIFNYFIFIPQMSSLSRVSPHLLIHPNVFLCLLLKNNRQTSKW